MSTVVVTRKKKFVNSQLVGRLRTPAASQICNQRFSDGATSRSARGYWLGEEQHRIDYAGSPKFIPTVRSLALSANSLYIRHEEKLIFVGVFHA